MWREEKFFALLLEDRDTTAHANSLFNLRCSVVNDIDEMDSRTN